MNLNTYDRLYKAAKRGELNLPLSPVNVNLYVVAAYECLSWIEGIKQPNSRIRDTQRKVTDRLDMIRLFLNSHIQSDTESN